MRELLTSILAIFFAVSAWGQQATLSGRFALTGQRTTAQTVESTILFQDDFETCDLVKWDSIVGNVGGTVAATAVNPFAGTCSLDIHYEASSGDNNRYVRESILSHPESVFVSAQVYHKTPEVGGDKHNIQRKIFYVLSPDDTSGWWLFLTSDSQVDGDLTFRVSTNDSNFGGSAATVFNWDSSGVWAWDAWHFFEMEAVLNTPGSSDGVVRLWVDGTLRGEVTNAHIRGTDTQGMQNFRFGNQVSVNTGAADEFRYLDNVKISTGYIGP